MPKTASRCFLACVLFSADCVLRPRSVRFAFFALVASLGTTCSSGGTGPGAAPEPVDVLAFRMPSVTAAVYRVVDSVTLSMAANAMEVQQAAAATLEMTFAEVPGGVRVAAVVADFDASALVPMGPPATADLDNLEGDLVFVLDATGEAQVESVPVASGPAAQAARMEGWAHELFPRLPNRPVQAGDSWQDTVFWSSEGAAATTSTGAYSYVASGDTLVDGRALLAIAVSGEVKVETKANQGGMAVTMQMEISDSAVALWDPALGLYRRIELDRVLTGTVAVEGMPGAALQITGGGPRTVRLLHGESQ